MSKPKSVLIPMIILLSVIIIPLNILCAQTNIISSNSNIKNEPKFSESDSLATIQEKLVQLALKQQEYLLGSYQEKIIQDQLKKSRRSWLDVLSISANYNDQTFAKTTTTSQYVYPKYFFGFTIPLGVIFNAGSDIKIAKENENINTAQQEIVSKKIRADILSKYQEYLSYGSLLIIETQTVNDAQAQFLQAEQKFKEGTITVDQYNQASKNYNTELVAKINLQLQQDLIKFDIERMIGMKLEDAMNIRTN